MDMNEDMRRMLTHNDALKLMLIELSRCGCMVARRDVGLFTDWRGRPRRVGVLGEADIQGVMPGGRALGVEIKTGKAEQSKQQKAWSRRFKEMGGKFILARILEHGDEKKIVKGIDFSDRKS